MTAAARKAAPIKICIPQVKGYSQSSLGQDHLPVPPSHLTLYERVWDEADYVVPPAENGAFFVMTNMVITPNQTLATCPEVRRTSSCSATAPCAGPW